MPKTTFLALIRIFNGNPATATSISTWLESNEARARNVAKAPAVLSGKKGRFMACDWNGARRA